MTGSRDGADVSVSFVTIRDEPSHFDWQRACCWPVVGFYIEGTAACAVTCLTDEQAVSMNTSAWEKDVGRLLRLALPTFSNWQTERDVMRQLTILRGQLELVPGLAANGTSVQLPPTP